VKHCIVCFKIVQDFQQMRDLVNYSHAKIHMVELFAHKRRRFTQFQTKIVTVQR
jgi:hypothetical protein